MLLSGAGAGACQDWTGSTTLDETEVSQGNHNNIMLIPFFRYMDSVGNETPQKQSACHSQQSDLCILKAPCCSAIK